MNSPSAAGHSAGALATLRGLLPQCLLPDQLRLGARLATTLARHRRGEHAPLPLERWIAEARASIAIRTRRDAVIRHLEYPDTLPITAHRDAIVRTLARHPVLIVSGETGSGKSTQLPKMCLEAGYGRRARIGCTQPRRVAALSISRRLAEELDVDWGRDVGCAIRFADHVRPETSVKVMTDGLLLAEVQRDPLLSEYEVILIDEAHERSLNIDFLLGHLRNLLRQRDDLHLVITSATIDLDRFAQAFDHPPIVEVSGRLYPVTLRYAPLDAEAEETGDRTYVDAAVDAVGAVLEEPGAGDTLVFLPSERDIREATDRLRRRQPDNLEVIPLFGRLTAAEQQRVFAPGPKRRVVVATNIAESSLTVPRIRYVIDTGLARISRYHPGTRSRRLPIEPIAQSNANQRAGRCGRIAPGVCIRLYAESEFLARPPHAEPEIRRCNLAEVLLRLEAGRLGKIETFPFIDPPPAAAIQNAYVLLQELGALDDNRQLTPMGEALARLPVDPAIGRMILEARRQHAVTEVLVIAAGLSIQDPRERPLDQKDAAAAAHRRFHHPQSDFLALLNIWNAYHDTWESLETQSQIRKFCRTHFLSFVRMREWVDVHAQLREALDDLDALTPNARPATYAAIHRAILAGLCGHVAQRIEKNTYRLAGQRTVHVFPRSALIQNTTRLHKPGPTPAHRPITPSPPDSKSGTHHGHTASAPPPEWIVAGENVETTRPYARTLAAIDPHWILELAPHLCRTACDQPRWDPDAGRVVGRERVLLRGLVLRERTVAYARHHPEEAKRIFLQAALLGDELPGEFPFLAHNRRLIEKLEFWQTRQSHRVVPDLEEALFAFYTSRLPQVSSWADLRRVLATPNAAARLEAAPADLLGDEAGRFDPSGLPDAITLGHHSIPVSYAYAPGQSHDGVTFRLTAPLAEWIEPGQLDWLVPALREERIAHLLRSLPKALRRPLMPLNAAARAIAQAVPPGPRPFLEGLSKFVHQTYGVAIAPADWPISALPDHLRPRFEVVGRQPQPLATGRDLAPLREQARRHVDPAQAAAWQTTAARWERYDLVSWDFGDLPESIAVAGSDPPLDAYPGLEREQDSVHLRLFRRRTEAELASRHAIPRLAELALRRDLAWLERELRSLDPLKVLYVTLGPGSELTATARQHLLCHLFPLPPAAFRTAREFAAYVEKARSRLPSLGTQLVDRLRPILEKRQEALLCRRPLPQMRREIDALVPPQFLLQVDFDRLPHLPRYLQALIVRAERAALSPLKDAEKAQRLRPYLEAATTLASVPAPHPPLAEAIRDFRWLLEEFKVSCFAQELGTALPVSAQRLDQALARIARER
ncbi:MAG TPA: ATP-dependent RNA helicase HrpA [Verrucomicrobiota bacterium]|nr:ATP-dependent RNA helicase HrpA [Verrucomicrobiota bacterium]HNU53068.1 ATP-dependent RNA helicase HrpA [Verrucomicrobiota bacterium]